jgi:hypothetical protein
VTINGHSATVSSISGNTYNATYTMQSSDPEGGVVFTIDFSDLTGNAGTQVNTTTDVSSVTFDKSLPTLTSVSISSNNTNHAKAKIGDIITVSLTANEPLTATPTVTINGHSATVSSISGNTYNATYTMQAIDHEGVVFFTIDFSDLTGNAGTQVTATTDASLVTFDTTFPVITIESPQNLIYNMTTISLNVSSYEEISTWNYSLNNGDNITFSPNITIEASQGENYITISAKDIAGNWNYITIYFSVDSIPPSTITNLNNTTSENHIRWTWTDPITDDFSYVMVYLDGVWVKDIYNGVELYEIWALNPETQYNISTQTVDIAGNINQTWVNGSATTSPIPLPFTGDQTIGFNVYYVLELDTGFSVGSS